MTPEREQRLAEALGEYVDLQARGEDADPDAFCRQHAELEPDLRAQLTTLLEMDERLEPPPELAGDELPERLSGHKILGVIGAGGMGRVLLAWDEGLARQVAVKILHRRYRDHPLVRARFLQEARAMARLSHPHVVRIYNLGQPEETPHFVMEYVEGVPLTEAARALPMRQKMELFHKVVLAVNFLHQHQVIHRDLKPGNILVGRDLEPKLLDFGLAVQVEESGERLTRFGELMGTPQYFSPEHTRAGSEVDARSDLFCLGIVLYELLTGVLPFRGETFAEQVHNIRDEDPALPRRLQPSLPGELQNICLKALEKNPASRYASALEMARDLERYLAGEPVLAAPTTYPRLMAGRVEQHLRELEGWRSDEILSAAEFDALKKGYDRLSEREDAWILEARRLTFSQVSLYLGAWVLVVGAALVVLFQFAGLTGTAAVLTVSAATAPAAWLGIRDWKRGRLRIAVAFLLAACLLLPTALVVSMAEYGLLAGFTRGDKKLEFFARFFDFERVTNARLWWSILLSVPAYLWLRRFTGSSVFSLVLAVMTALFSLVSLLRMGLLEWLDQDPGKLYFHLMPVALAFFVTSFLLERFKRTADSRYFYPIAVLFTWVSFSGVAAFHEPYTAWLKWAVPGRAVRSSIFS